MCYIQYSPNLVFVIYLKGHGHDYGQNVFFRFISTSISFL